MLVFAILALIFVLTGLLITKQLTLSRTKLCILLLIFGSFIFFAAILSSLRLNKIDYSKYYQSFQSTQPLVEKFFDQNTEYDTEPEQETSIAVQDVPAFFVTSKPGRCDSDSTAVVSVSWAKPEITDDKTLINWWIKETSPSLDTVRKSMSKSEMVSQALRHFYKPVLTPLERINLLQTAKICLDLVEQAGMTPILMATNLIGYYRHNKSLSPFDDDFDVAVLITSIKEREDYRSKFAKLTGSHDVVKSHYVSDASRLKCFNRHRESCLRRFPGLAWCWPFIDVQFFLISNEHRFYVDIANPATVIPVDVFYPPKRVVYSELKIPAFVPHDICRMMQYANDLSICRARPLWNHRKENWGKRVVWAKCATVNQFSPFVYLNDNEY